MDKELEELLKDHPLPKGAYILERIDLNNKDILDLCDQLIRFLPQDQAEVMKQIKKDYAKRNNIDLFGFNL